MQDLIAQRLYGLQHPQPARAGHPRAGREDRYKRIVADPQGLDALLVELFLEAHAEAPEEIVLDVDATDDPLHGEQEGAISTATTTATAPCRCT